jgi:hypothetical protein
MVKCERASQKEARFLFRSDRSVSFFGFLARASREAFRQESIPRAFCFPMFWVWKLAFFLEATEVFLYCNFIAVIFVIG